MTIANPELRRGNIGVKIVDARNGSVIYQRNAENYFMPASNMKSYTVATAIETLTPSFRFRTSIYAVNRPDSNGVLQGNLIIYGRGDPSFSSAFSEGNPLARVDQLVDKIVASGVKTINGSVVADETYFNSTSVPYGWEWDDLQWYYGAEVSSLTILDNTIGMTVKPGSVGTSAIFNIDPFNSLVRIKNTTRTTPRGSKRTLRIKKQLDANIFEISGDLPVGNRGFNGRIAVSNPALLFADILTRKLKEKGVNVSNQPRTIDRDDRDQKLDETTHVELASTLSPPLSEIAAKTMKPSQNLYTELLLRTIGERLRQPDDQQTTSDKIGSDAVQSLLLRAGVSPRSVIQYDGSGLSRHNLITPDSAVKLYQYMDRSRFGNVWRNSLTIGGVDGTLRNRFRNTTAQANVRGKTGTLDQVSALSGYVTSKSGKRFTFSVLTNNIPNRRLRNSTIDQIVLLLSNYDGELAETKMASE